MVNSERFLGCLAGNFPKKCLFFPGVQGLSGLFKAAIIDQMVDNLKAGILYSLLVGIFFLR